MMKLNLYRYYPNIYKRTLILFCLHTVFITCCFDIKYSYSQPAILWQLTVGDSLSEAAKSICKSFDGGFYTAGGTSKKVNDTCSNIYDAGDVWVVRFDKNRNLIWMNCYGGSEGDSGNGIVATADGGCVIAAGSYSNNGDVSGNHGDQDYWIFKLDSNGIMQWQHSYGGSSTEYVNSITNTIDGGFIITGLSYSSDGDVPFNYSIWYYCDAWVIKLDSMGNMQWNQVLGGTAFDVGLDAVALKNQSYAVLMQTNSTDYDLIGVDPFKGYNYSIIWLDSLGNKQSVKWYEGNLDEMGGNLYECVNRDLIIGGYGNSAVFYNIPTGYHFGPNGSTPNDGLVIRVDSVGNLLWAKAYGGSGTDGLRPIYELPDGNIMVAGNTISNDGDVSCPYTQNNLWTIKINSQGDLIWSLAIGGNDYEAVQSALLWTNNSLILAGQTESKDGDVAIHYGNAVSDLDMWLVEVGDFNNIPTQIIKPIVITVWPNPFQDKFEINIENITGSFKWFYRVFNLQGQTILANSVSGFQKQDVTINNLQSGIYFLELKDAKGTISKTIKIIKQ